MESGGRPALLIYAAGKEAAVDSDDLAGHETGRLRSEEDRCAGQFFDLPETTHGSAKSEFLAACSSLKKPFIESRLENTGSDRVDANAVLRPFDCERFSE